MYDTNETPTTGDSSRWRNYHQLMWTQQQLQMQLQQQQQQNHQQHLQLIHHHPQQKQQEQQQQQQQEQQMQNQRMSALSIDCSSNVNGNGSGGIITSPSTSSSCAMVSNSTVTQGQQQHQNHEHHQQETQQQQSCSTSVPTPEKSPVPPSSGSDKATPSKCDAAPSWENFDAQAAFLGPSLWDKRVPTDGQDFKVLKNNTLEYVDLEEFLTENGIPVDQQQQQQHQQQQQQQQQSQNHNNHNHDNHPNHNQFHHKIPSGASTSTSTSTSTATSASAAAASASAPSPVGVAPHHAPMGACGSPTSMVHHFPGPSGNPHGHHNGINPGVVNGQPPHNMMHGQAHGHTPIPSRSCSPCGSSVSWSSEESSQMGHFPDMHHHPPEYFDPRTRIFSEEELKPQPMIKKSKKQMIPDDLKDAKYWARRRKNNMAAKRSRDARRIKENQIAMRTCFLEKENSVLKQEIDRIQKENSMLKNQLNCCQREH